MIIKDVEIILSTVKKMGGTIEKILPERGCFYIKIGRKKFLVDHRTSLIRHTYYSEQPTRCKDLTHTLLVSNGLPSPDTAGFYLDSFSAPKAMQRLKKMTYPVIIKDATGSQSLGVFPYITTPQEAFTVLTRQLPRYKTMVVQQMVFGKEYRLLVLDEKIIGILEMIPPSVIGNGRDTVRALIIKKQKTTEQKTVFNRKLNQILREQGVSLKTILPKNKQIFFKKNSCLAEGGETRNATGLAHPEVVKMGVAAAKLVGKFLVGIDVICDNISLKPKKGSFHILEINGKPDLYIHYEPTHGQTTDVIRTIVQFLLKLAK